MSGSSGSGSAGGSAAGSVPGGGNGGGGGIEPFGSDSGFSGSESGSGLESGMSSGSGSSSGLFCSDAGWVKDAQNGAAWTGDEWTLRISFQDSGNCGGPNNFTQFGTATRTVCLNGPARLTVHMVGRVERQDFGFEYGEARVNGMLICSGGSFGEGLGCAMADNTADGTIDLTPGEHLVELYANTNDQLYHVGAYWEFQMVWEAL
jgi:hypothetical protein